jgi:hypothetical protein
MKKLQVLLGIALLGVFAFSGCTKEGPAGPAGTNGVNGNANVIGTNSVFVSNWTLSGTSYIASITVPDITPDVVNYGLVEVYIQYGTAWFCLPDIIGINSTTFGFQAGVVDLQNSNSDNSVPALPSNVTIRVVVIPANAIKAHPNVNWRSYSQASQFIKQ